MGLMEGRPSIASSPSMIVYRYGALKPIAGFEAMLDQLRAANRYYNDALETAYARRAALHFGVSKDEVKVAYNQRQRELYAKYASAGLIGARTLRLLEQAVARSVAKRWKCWSKTGRWKSPYRRFDGTGSLAANSQTAVLRFARVEVVDADRRRPHAICHLRTVGAQVVSVPFVLDRPLPADSDVAAAALHVERCGERWTYSLTFTLRNASPRPLPRGESGAASINFGWRTLPDGSVRVATVVGDDGTTFFEIPSAMMAKRAHVEATASLADTLAVAVLGNSRRRHSTRRRVLSGLGPSPLNRERFEAGDPVALEHWARRDRHPWEIECNERARLLRQRREMYRIFARSLRTRYASVTIEDYSMAQLARLCASEGTPRAEAASRVRFVVAPGELRAEIKRVFGDDCHDLHTVVRTKRCHACGRRCEFDAAADLVHECEHCGAVWDQDVNNALNQRHDSAAE